MSTSTVARETWLGRWSARPPAHQVRQPQSRAIERRALTPALVGRRHRHHGWRRRLLVTTLPITVRADSVARYNHHGWQAPFCPVDETSPEPAIFSSSLTLPPCHLPPPHRNFCAPVNTT